MIALEFPIEPTDTAIGVMPSREHRAEAASIETFFNPRSVAVIGASPPPGHRRPGAGAQPRARRLHRPGLRREPDGQGGLRPAGVLRRVGDIPGDVDVADRRGAGRVGPGRRARLRRQGRARPDRHLLGLRRDRRGGPAAAAPAGRAVPLLRPAADRPELPRHHQHRPAGQPQRLAVVADAAARPGRLLLPVRRARLGDPGEGQQPRPRASRRSSAPATAPTSRATTSCSTGRRTTPPRSCCSTSSRSATRASSAGSPAGSRCASRSSRCAPAAPPRACRWATRCARSARRRRPSTRCSARPA